VGAPGRRRGVEHIIDRGGGGFLELPQLDSVLAEKLDSLEHATGRFLATT
jgi:hypothetical protein